MKIIITKQEAIEAWREKNKIDTSTVVEIDMATPDTSKFLGTTIFTPEGSTTTYPPVTNTLPTVPPFSTNSAPSVYTPPIPNSNPVITKTN